MLELSSCVIDEIKRVVVEASTSSDFIHNKWYLKYHLELVEKLSLELCNIYKSANNNLVLALVWLHDYNKIFGVPENADESCGAKLLRRIGLGENEVLEIKKYVEIIESRNIVASDALEVKIVSSADGASHFVGPFYYFWWYENSDASPNKLMKDNYEKALRDWNKKIVLPEVKQAFKARFEFLLEQCGNFPDKYIDI